AVHVVLLACSHSRCSISDVRLCSVVNLGATTVIYSLSLHDALPILTRSPRSGREPPLSSCVPRRLQPRGTGPQRRHPDQRQTGRDRKSTRLNSSHGSISYAVFCLQNNKRPEAFESFLNTTTNLVHS